MMMAVIIRYVSPTQRGCEIWQPPTSFGISHFCSPSFVRRILLFGYRSSTPNKNEGTRDLETLIRPTIVLLGPGCNSATGVRPGGQNARLQPSRRRTQSSRHPLHIQKRSIIREPNEFRSFSRHHSSSDTLRSRNPTPTVSHSIFWYDSNSSFRLSLPLTRRNVYTCLSPWGAVACLDALRPQQP